MTEGTSFDYESLNKALSAMKSESSGPLRTTPHGSAVSIMLDSTIPKGKTSTSLGINAENGRSVLVVRCNPADEKEVAATLGSLILRAQKENQYDLYHEAEPTGIQGTIGGKVMLTEEQIKKYIESNGIACPYCGTELDLVDEGDPEFVGGRIYLKSSCLSCKNEWTDILKIVGIEEATKCDDPSPEEEE